jgi:hypothetical protein
VAGLEGPQGNDAFYLAGHAVIMPGQNQVKVEFLYGPLSDNRYVILVTPMAAEGHYYDAVILEKEGHHFTVGLRANETSLVTVPKDIEGGVTIEWAITLQMNSR